jgi:hypothetical protein
VEAVRVGWWSLISLWPQANDWQRIPLLLTTTRMVMRQIDSTTPHIRWPSNCDRDMRRPRFTLEKGLGKVRVLKPTLQNPSLSSWTRRWAVFNECRSVERQSLNAIKRRHLANRVSKAYDFLRWQAWFLHKAAVQSLICLFSLSFSSNPSDYLGLSCSGHPLFNSMMNRASNQGCYGWHPIKGSNLRYEVLWFIADIVEITAI